MVFLIVDLPTNTVDIIVNCLDNSDNSNHSAQYNDLIDWCNNNKANVLSLDPPNHKAAVKTQWSLGVALPLDLGESWGKPYLCDVGIPPCVYKQLGISYQSPFANKFYIPLHVDDNVAG